MLSEAKNYIKEFRFFKILLFESIMQIQLKYTDKKNQQFETVFTNVSIIEGLIF